jgi:general secretion pathway protein G
MKARKGFTLVELLIVIVIIGILVGAMLMSSGSATDSATAAAILAELRGLKGAASMYFADHEVNPTSIADLTTYMDNKAKMTGTGASDYTLATGMGASIAQVMVGYQNTTKLSSGVKQKLADKATQSGIYAASNATGQFTTGATIVWMVAR